jgi:hypothetical protein
VGFNEYGKYISTYPYIKNEEDKNRVIGEAIKKAKKLGKELTR